MNGLVGLGFLLGCNEELRHGYGICPDDWFGGGDDS